MQTLEARFRIVTPMFIGDAGQTGQKATDIRPPSIKGALRFWWRALNWSKFTKAHAGNEPAALRALHDEEARLFGIAAGGESGGQGVFLLSVAESKIERTDEPFKNMTDSQMYLLGMGIAKYSKDKGKYAQRNALVNGEFSVRLIFRPRCTGVDIQSISDALYALGLLGALGSRARHGMGSVALTEWKGDGRAVPNDIAAYKAALREYLKNLPAGLPPFTAFSQQSRIDVSATASDSMKLLTEIGSELQMYRSYGQNGKVGGKTAERKFAEDHDLIMNATNGKQIKCAPQRVVFGLPHNYFFSSTKAKADVNYAPQGKDGRRASPLLFHVHQFGSGESLAVHTLLPAQFLPPSSGIRIKTKISVTVPAQVNWQVLHNYMNRFPQRETIYG